VVVQQQQPQQQLQHVSSTVDGLLTATVYDPPSRADITCSWRTP
jgi:hypothetical protein